MECCLVCVLLAISTRALHALGKHSLDWFLLANFLGIFKEPRFFEPLFLCWFICFYLYFLTFACFGISFFKFILLSYILSWLKFPFPPSSVPYFPIPLPLHPLFLPVLFKTGQVSQGYPPNMAYQVSERLGTSLMLSLDGATQQEESITFKFFKSYFLMMVLKH